MSGHPPPKRQRTNDAQKDAEIQRARFWFDDGNVILQAENTQFRVHRSLLSLHSNVFGDMFSMPQPTDTTTLPNADGCPVVALSDTASDLEHFLSVLYENFQSHDMRKMMPFSDLAAILRLGKKYEIDHLCDEGLKRLRREYPNTLEKWNTSCNAYVAIEPHDPQAIIQLCHELSILACLPAAYLFFVSVNKSGDIIDRSLDNGGTMDRQMISHSLRGRDELIQAYHCVFVEWVKEELLSPGKQCASEACRYNKLLAFQSSFSSADGKICRLEPYNITDFKVCKPCLDLLMIAYDKAREELWDRLPSFFGLPPWEELKDFDAGYNSSNT